MMWETYPLSLTRSPFGRDWQGSSAAYAVQPDEIMSDPAKEARARDLSRELRCMVCQNQSIDDSEAPLARDLRLLVRERIAAGDTDAQVIDFLVARYGEFVLLKPRLSLTRICCGCCRRWRWPVEVRAVDV